MKWMEFLDEWGNWFYVPDTLILCCKAIFFDRKTIRRPRKSVNQALEQRVLSQAPKSQFKEKEVVWKLKSWWWWWWCIAMSSNGIIVIIDFDGNFLIVNQICWRPLFGFFLRFFFFFFGLLMAKWIFVNLCFVSLMVEKRRPEKKWRSEVRHCWSVVDCEGGCEGTVRFGTRLHLLL